MLRTSADAETFDGVMGAAEPKVLAYRSPDTNAYVEGTRHLTPAGPERDADGGGCACNRHSIRFLPSHPTSVTVLAATTDLMPADANSPGQRGSNQWGSRAGNDPII